MGEKVQGISSINDRYKIDRGKVKNSIGNGEAKELICMTHGHAWKWGGNGDSGQRRLKGKKWDNCNSIIKKIYF